MQDADNKRQQEIEDKILELAKAEGNILTTKSLSDSQRL